MRSLICRVVVPCVSSVLFGCGPAPVDAGPDGDAGAADAGGLIDGGQIDDAGVGLDGPLVTVRNGMSFAPYAGVTVTLLLSDGTELSALTDEAGHARFRAVDFDSEGPVTLMTHRPGQTIRMIVGLLESDFDGSDGFVVGTWSAAIPDEETTAFSGDVGPLPGGASSGLLVTTSHMDAAPHEGMGPAWSILGPRNAAFTVVAANYTIQGSLLRGFHQDIHAWATVDVAPASSDAVVVDMTFANPLATTTVSGSFALPNIEPLKSEGIVWVGVTTKKSLGVLRTGLPTSTTTEAGAATYELEHITLPDDPNVTLFAIFKPGWWGAQVAQEGVPSATPLDIPFLPVPEFAEQEPVGELVWGEPWSLAGPNPGVPLLLFVVSAWPLNAAPIRVDFPHGVDTFELPLPPPDAITDPALGLTGGGLMVMPVWCEYDDGIFDGTDSWCTRNTSGPAKPFTWTP